MIKQQIIKWSKKIGIIVCSFIGVWLLIMLVYFAYTEINRNYFIPKKYETLCKEGYTNINKADKIALELMSNSEFHNSEDKAIDILLNAARKGSTPAAVLLGRYYKGYDVHTGFNSDWTHRGEEYLEKSSYWYLQAAKRGNAEAQGEMGHNYKYGIGVKQDFNKAIYWLKLGAEGGNPVAEWRLGNIYLNGLALYDIDFLHTNYWYTGDGEFRSLDNEIYQVKESYLREVLSKPTKIYFKPDISKAKYYWELAASQGLQEAKDALEKVYD